MSQNRPQGNNDSDLLFSALSRLELPTPEQVRITRAATDIADPHAVDDLRELLNDKFFARIENVDRERTLFSKLDGKFKELPEKQRIFKRKVFPDLETVLGCLPDRQEFFEGIATLENPTILGFIENEFVVIDGGKSTPDKTSYTSYSTAWKESQRRAVIDEMGRKRVFLWPLSEGKDNGNRTLSTRGIISVAEALLATKVFPKDYYDEHVITFVDEGADPVSCSPGKKSSDDLVYVLKRLFDFKPFAVKKGEPHWSGYLSAVRFTLD